MLRETMVLEAVAYCTALEVIKRGHELVSAKAQLNRASL
jgi:hypothetical protein